MSKNLSYIPTLRGPNCNLRRSILPCFLCCNASHLILSAYLPHLLRCPTWFAIFCHSSCSCLDVNMRQNGNLCGASDNVRQICAQDQVQSVTTRETEQADPGERTTGYYTCYQLNPRARGNGGISSQCKQRHIIFVVS